MRRKRLRLQCFGDSSRLPRNRWLVVLDTFGAEASKNASEQTRGACASQQTTKRV